MREPASTVALSYAVTRTTCDAAKQCRVSWCVSSDVLFLKSPAWFDGIEVWRVRRQVEDANATLGTCWPHPRVMVCAEVVHDENVAAPQLRQETLRQPSHEAVFRRGVEHRAENHPASESDGAQDGEPVFPAVDGQPIDVFVAAFHPGVAAAHRQVHPRFVEEDESPRGDPADSFQESRTFRDDIGPQTLKRPSALFFTT